MAVSPACQIKRLSDCEAGQMVRLVGHFGQGDFGLVADLKNAKGGRALIVFEEDKPQGWVVVEKAETLKVLAYDSVWALDIDPHGTYESNIRTMYDKAGGIIREGSRCLLNVRAIYSQGKEGRFQYALDSSHLASASKKCDDIMIYR